MVFCSLSENHLDPHWFVEHSTVSTQVVEGALCPCHQEEEEVADLSHQKGEVVEDLLFHQEVEVEVEDLLFHREEEGAVEGLLSHRGEAVVVDLSSRVVAVEVVAAAKDPNVPGEGVVVVHSDRNGSFLHHVKEGPHHSGQKQRTGKVEKRLKKEVV